jgi:hypothetical protein
MSSTLETDNKKNDHVDTDVNTDVVEPKDFSTITMEVSTKYIVFLQELYEKYKYHPELAGQLESDIKGLKKNMENEQYLLYFLTSNYLFCLEPISDHNIDYFMYQKEKTVKKSGKVVKNKITKVIGKITLKKILKESEISFHNKIFSTIYEIFMNMTVKNENDTIVFNDEYIQFIKDNLSEDRNFSKMLMVMDNLDTILSSDNVVDETDIIKEAKKEEADKKKDKKKKSKSSSSNPLSALTGALGGDFMNGLESTKIAQLAKNISEKINTDEFPLLNDPSKLLSSLTGGGEDGNNNIQNLLKFVVGEVENEFKTNNINEKDLLGEAQNIMSQFQGMSGFDPMSLLKNLSGAIGGNNGEGLPDMKQFESIFSNIQKK